MSKSDVDIRASAKHFAEYWKGKGYEKGESQKFWISLLGDVFGVDHATEYIDFEDQVHLDHTSFIDGFIPATKVLIEQKSLGKSLTAPIQQSDGSLLSPLQQAQRYVHALLDEKGRQAVPRWVVTCNFEEFRVYDLDHPQNDAQVVKLADLPEEYYRLKFLVNEKDEALKREMELSLKAGEMVGKIHDRFLEKYHDPMAVHTQRSLNILCVRLVFCLYAEDAGLFGAKDAFTRYIAQYEPKDLRTALINLFKVLDTPYAERPDLYLSDELEAFPYVNGGLFKDENIVIPQLTGTLKDIILESANFDWSKISPTIFGAVFESTLNPTTRRTGGMHYTTIENIHKVIDPLFLDDLKKELEEIMAIPVVNEKNKKLRQFQRKLANLTFLDPACGSGNFLTETYVCLRRLENDALLELHNGQVMIADEWTSPIQVSIHQFYGIEINDFAVSVAKTALWIAESQMMKETEDVILMPLDFLPLKTNAKIVEGNALRMDWNRIVSKNDLNYIIGNPPFVGYSLQSPSQKDDILSIYLDENKKPYKTAGKMDYVSGWFWKASEMMYGTSIKAALVSTNSITQGEQVAYIWEPLFSRFNIHFDFAYRTFVWDSETNLKAHVHCVIIGFSYVKNNNIRILFDNGNKILSDNITPYLTATQTVFIKPRKKPLCNVPCIVNGGKPAEGGYLILDEEEAKNVIKNDSIASKYLRHYMMGIDFINRRPRYCLWLVNASPTDLKTSPELFSRVEKVRAFRLSSQKEATRKKADTPALFQEVKECHSKYIVIPVVSSERRRYIPVDYLSPEIIAGNKLFYMENASLYHFGIIESNVHMSWMRAVAGRLKSDYSYSNTVVYNTFPWPVLTDKQKSNIEETAQGILNARALYPDCTLAELYDPITMPPELRTAHQKNDRAVMEAYGFWGKLNTEAECVAELMKMYQALTEKGDA